MTLASEALYLLSQPGILLTKLRHEFLEFFSGPLVVCHVLRLAQNHDEGLSGSGHECVAG